MQARGALMMEHRLIERVIALMETAVADIEATGKVDALFIDAVVDLIGTYADRTHHGKEEDILFRELGKKALSADDGALMNKLLEDHRFGRSTTQALADARARYCDGETAAAEDISNSLKALVALYPPHIELEDKVFFPHSREYVTDQEDQAMIAEFREFDRNMIHEKYRTVVDRLGG
jgi:hemerythrin-like domain-containing protein